MSRKLVFALCLFVFLSTLVLYVRSTHVEVKAPTGYPVHNIDTGLNYTTIQEAIDANETDDGHTIFVEAGTYYENVVVNKSLALVGDNSGTTIIDGNETGTVLNIIRNNVNISGFTIQNSQGAGGIHLEGVIHCSICGNNITANGGLGGIFLEYSSNNTLFGNNITDNDTGIYVYSSSDNSISGNNITKNYNGIYLEISSNNTICRNKVTSSQLSGIFLSESHCNTLSENNVTNNSRVRGGSGIGLSYSSNNTIYQNNIAANEWWGINPTDSNNNTICRNNIENNNVGINFATANYNTVYGNNITENEFSGIYHESSSNNSFYHNNFFNNTNQVTVETGNGYTPNMWDTSVEGNYWSDYAGVDVDSGGDGLGDNPYVIDLNNTDGHPLMGPVSFFDAGTWDEKTYYVHTVSNSSVSDFNFNVSSQVVSFNVTGSNGALGFCRIAIPRELLWCDDIFDWTVRVNGTSVPIRIQEYVEYTYLYFTYSHSVQTVEVYGSQAIPEFSSVTILLFFIVATITAALSYRRKQARKV